MAAPPFLIGLTGGIASGKSAAAAAFVRRGVPVIDADQLAREVVEPGEPALAAIARAFGAEVIAPDGRLERRRLRGVVFADAARRRELESIVHPAIGARMQAALAQLDAPYAVVAVPLLAENRQAARFNRVLVVDCPPELQLERLLARDGETPAGARAILAAQARREERLAVADDVLDNTGTLAALDARVDALHQRYLSLAGDPARPGPVPPR